MTCHSSNHSYLRRLALKAANINDKNNSAAVYVGSTLKVHNPTGGHFACACVHPLNDNSVGTVLLKAISLVL